MWEVERVSGASAGKRMDVPVSALEPVTQNDHVLSVRTSAGKARLVLERNGRNYTVKAFAVEGREDLSLAFAAQAPGFENLDTTSDIAQCFNLSTKVRYGNVVLGNTEMRANSIEELQYALAQAKVRTFNHEEI
ncbi:hypothetical protein WJ84_02540 [Burkholderia ubonensis]|nr:hypothetical protein WJ84_02540 [Burkholderia ubonensis]